MPLYNKVKATDLPAAVGTWGIDSNVWGLLITLTESKCKELKIPLSDRKYSLKGWCIWASVVATKFYVHKFARVVRVKETSDQYFVVVQNNNQTGICDITCNQFGGPDYITGSLKDVKATAQRVNHHGLSLYDAYALGAKSNTFVI